jgi:hypothetical protein
MGSELDHGVFQELLTVFGVSQGSDYLPINSS